MPNDIIEKDEGRVRRVVLDSIKKAHGGISKTKLAESCGISRYKATLAIACLIGEGRIAEDRIGGHKLYSLV